MLRGAIKSQSLSGLKGWRILKLFWEQAHVSIFFFTNNLIP